MDFLAKNGGADFHLWWQSSCYTSLRLPASQFLLMREKQTLHANFAPLRARGVSNTGPSQSQNSLNKWSMLSTCWWPMSWDMGPPSPWSLPSKTPFPQKRWKSRWWPPRTETELLCGVASRWLCGAPFSRVPDGHVRNSFLGPQVGIHAMDNNTTIHKF